MKPQVFKMKQQEEEVLGLTIEVDIRISDIFRSLWIKSKAIVLFYIYWWSSITASLYAVIKYGYLRKTFLIK